MGILNQAPVGEILLFEQVEQEPGCSFAGLKGIVRLGLEAYHHIGGIHDQAGDAGVVIQGRHDGHSVANQLPDFREYLTLHVVGLLGGCGAME